MNTISVIWHKGRSKCYKMALILTWNMVGTSLNLQHSKQKVPILEESGRDGFEVSV